MIVNNHYNEYVLSKLKENNHIKNDSIIKEMRKISPSSIKNDELLLLYNKSVSIHQSRKQYSGAFLENEIINKILDEQSISYRKQVTIDSSGIITSFEEKRSSSNCFHIIDFVIGEDIEISTPISEYIVVSCKTTCRERWTQDDWSFTFIPELYILLTTSNDYPNSSRFREAQNRKIITCNPKKKRDDRNYKLNFDDLVSQLK